MTSRRLNDLLTAGLAADLAGEGAFLQVSRNVTPGEKPRTWKVGDKRIDPNSDTVYRVAIPDFLVKGGEKAYREAGLLKERKTEEDLQAMRLDADGIALSDTDRGKGKRPEIRAGLVRRTDSVGGEAGYHPRPGFDPSDRQSRETAPRAERGDRPLRTHPVGWRLPRATAADTVTAPSDPEVDHAAAGRQSSRSTPSPSSGVAHDDVPSPRLRHHRHGPSRSAPGAP